MVSGSEKARSRFGCSRSNRDGRRERGPQSLHGWAWLGLLAQDLPITSFRLSGQSHNLIGSIDSEMTVANIIKIGER